MINWFAVSYNDMITLALLAASHGWGIHDMLQRLNQLPDKEREVVESILDECMDAACSRVEGLE